MGDVKTILTFLARGKSKSSDYERIMYKYRKYGLNKRLACLRTHLGLIDHSDQKHVDGINKCCRELIANS